MRCVRRVVGRHVRGIVERREGEIACLDPGADRGLVEEVRRGARMCAHARLPLPCQRIDEALVPQRRAHQVLVAGEQQHTHALLQQRREEVHTGLLGLGGGPQHAPDAAIALDPGLGLQAPIDVQGAAHVRPREVRTHGADLRGPVHAAGGRRVVEAQVEHVDAALAARHARERQVLDLDGHGLTLGVLGAHHRVFFHGVAALLHERRHVLELGSLRLPHAGQLHRLDRCAVLRARVDEAIPDHHAAQRERRIGRLQQGLGHIGNVLPRVALAREVHVRVVARVLGVPLHETTQECDKLVGDLLQRLRERVAVHDREARADRLIDVHHVRVLVPCHAARHAGQCAVPLEPERAELQERAVHAGAAGAAIEPEDQLAAPLGPHGAVPPEEHVRKVFRRARRTLGPTHRHVPCIHTERRQAVAPLEPGQAHHGARPAGWRGRHGGGESSRV